MWLNVNTFLKKYSISKSDKSFEGYYSDCFLKDNYCLKKYRNKIFDIPVFITGLKEILIYKEFKHPNIAQLLDYTLTNEGDIILALERGNDIRLGLSKKEITMEKISEDISDVLLYLRKKGFCHTDININNLIQVDDKIKLIDFGNADFCIYYKYNGDLDFYHKIKNSWPESIKYDFYELSKITKIKVKCPEFFVPDEIFSFLPLEKPLKDVMLHIIYFSKFLKNSIRSTFLALAMTRNFYKIFFYDLNDYELKKNSFYFLVFFYYLIDEDHEKVPFDILGNYFFNDLKPKEFIKFCKKIVKSNINIFIRTPWDYASSMEELVEGLKLLISVDYLPNKVKKLNYTTDKRGTADRFVREIEKVYCDMDNFFELFFFKHYVSSTVSSFSPVIVDGLDETQLEDFISSYIHLLNKKKQFFMHPYLFYYKDRIFLTNIELLEALKKQDWGLEAIKMLKKDEKESSV